MAFSISSLPDYTEQNRSELLSAAVLSPKSSTIFSLMPGVKGPTTINLLNTGVTFQSASSCGFNASGDDTITQRTITPALVKINKEWCPKALVAKYLVNEVSIGAGREELPFEQKIMTDVLAKVGAELEKALWQGNTTSGSGNMAFFNGLCTTISADVTSTAIPSGNVSTALSTDTVYKRVYDTYMAIPDNVLQDSAIFMSYANYRNFMNGVMDKNFFHYERNVDGTMETILPGTNTRVIGIPGLTGVNTIYSMVPEEVVYGFDTEDDAQTFSLWYSQDNDTFRLKIEFSAGINYAFPAHIIVNKPYGA